MLDTKDLQELQSMISQSESRMVAYVESAVIPKFNLLADGQAAILEKMVPRSRVDECPADERGHSKVEESSMTKAVLRHRLSFAHRRATDDL